MSTITEKSSLVRGLQVSGGRAYEGHQWREAILAYLGGVWSGDMAVMSRPKLQINNTTLRLDARGKKYFAYYVCEPDCDKRYPTPDRLPYHVSIPNQNDVESGLIRFVRDESIRHLILDMDIAEMVVLMKVQRRSELHITTFNLSSMTEVMRNALV